jgi:DNA-binding response OmpR family regulator
MLTTPPSQQLRILVVDDDDDTLNRVERALRLEGFDVSVSTHAIGVSNLVRSFNPDLVLIDVNIPELSGDRLLKLARRYAIPSTRFVLYSACDETSLRALAQHSGADGYVTKSTEMSKLAEKLRGIIAKKP